MFLVRCFLSRTEALWAFICIVVLSNKSPESQLIISPSRWLHTLPHLPEHDGGLLNHSRNGLRQYRGCDCLGATLCEMPRKCSRIHSRDSPSDRRGRQPSDNFHQKPCCELREGARLSWVLSASIYRGRQELLLYQRHTDHAPYCTSSCNTPVRA